MRSSLSSSAARSPVKSSSIPAGLSFATALSSALTVSLLTLRASAILYPRRNVATRSALR